MKQKSFLFTIIILLLLNFSAGISFWETKIVTPALAQGTFCSNLSKTTEKINSQFSKAQNDLKASRDRAESKAKDKSNKADAEVKKSRAKEDQTRNNIYKQLEAQAINDAQKQVVTVFKNTVEKAVSDRRVATDTTIGSFRQELDRLFDSRTLAMDTAIATYKALADAAITKAQTDCSNNVSSSTVRQNFIFSLDAARQTYRNALKDADKLIASAKNLAQVKKQTIQKAHDDFKKALEQAITELKKAFAQTPAPTLTPSPSAGVPGEYQTLYPKLEGKLNNFIAKVDREWNGSKHPVVFSAGLITANPNYGDTLLTPQIWDMSVKYMDKLQKLGVKGITVDINFPLLDPNFRNGEKYQQYLDFYKKLVSEIRKRNMTFNAEVQPVFPDYSSLPVKEYYESMTFDVYKQRVAAMLVIVAKELKPDYLTIENEPDTAEGNTGFPIGNLNNSLGMVNLFVDELKKSGVSGVKYGAGFGTWQKDYKTWTEKYTEETDIDFLNIHFYPVDGDYLDRALTISDMAIQNGKGLAIHESWLYKWQSNESAGIAVSKDIYSRDAYSFWSPLDQKFVEALVKLAHYKKYEYISPFFSNYFFGYLDYDSAKDLSATDRLNQAVKQGVNDALSGKISETGKRYQELITQ